QPAELQPIPLANRAGKLALSFAQQRLWFLDHLDHAAGAAYHLPQALRLKGALNTAALHATLDRVIARHESLRTRFELLDGEPVQKIAPADHGFQLAEHDLSGLPEAERAAALERLGEATFAGLFDLAQGPLLRGCLIRLDEDEHVLLITLHHIVSDGWSTGVFAHEVSVLYSAFSQGLADPLPALPIQYADYAAWQRQWLEGAKLLEQTQFWRSHLEGAPSLLNLPLDRPRPAVQRYAGGILACSLPAALSADLHAFSQANGATLFMTLLAGWSSLMLHLSGQSEVVVGTPVANRQRSELEPLIGFFANTLALRVAPEPGETIVQLLARIKTLTLAAYSHQDLPFEQVVSAVQPIRNMSHSPLFQVMLSFNNTPAALLQLPDLSVESLESAHTTTQFDLSLSLIENEGLISGSLQYASDLFDTATVETMLGLYIRVLEAMLADTRQPLGTLLAALPVLARVESTSAAPAAPLPEELPYAAPQGETEQAIARLWQDLFQVERISRHDDFFRLGGISLMAVQMTSRLRKVLGKPVAVRDLFVEPSLAGFARTLDSQSRTGFSNLVPVRRSGSQRPLFLVHPLGGEVQYVRDLAPALDADVPLYGLAASGFAPGEVALPTVEAMAARYLAALREVQAQGPYRIAGWSAGGLIAYEMAHQLLARGERIEFLGIIDASAHPGPVVPETLDEAQFLLSWLPERIEPALRARLEELAAQGAIEPMLTLCQEQGLLPEELNQDIEASQLRRHLGVAYATRLAIGAYVSPPLAVSIALFTAIDQPRSDPTLGWHALLDGRVHITPLPGTHNSLVQAPQVNALGEAIARALCACRQEEANPQNA
ncbi:MAG TPA: condensation domain-containing protein, partial [Pseudomonas sp.]|nr:condensation domain-containing protein [Pseudomonas sp.]